MSYEHMKIETKLIHAGEPQPRLNGAVVMPIHQSSTYEYRGETNYHDLRYIRLNNTPTHDVLHAKIAALENGEAALVASSGMAAISATLLTTLSAGDHLLVQDCVYGGTNDFIIHDLSACGMEYTFIDVQAPDTWISHLRPKTKAIYVESITNPMMQVADLKAVVAFAQQHKIVSMIDNTFTSPINFRPLEMGFDYVLHSCTKYMNGHHDIVAGCVVGKSTGIDKIRRKLNHLGGALDPHACFLLHRGLKTLALRVRQQNTSAVEVAKFLENHRQVERVHYPGLENHPHYQRARELFSGCSGMLSFEPKGEGEAAAKIADSVKLFIHAPSQGGVDSLIVRPAVSSHAGLSDEEKKRSGITEALVRLSIGIEATEDLIADLDQALNKI